jgi:hypothetical protein
MTIHLVVQVYKPSQVQKTKELLMNKYHLNCISTFAEKRLIIFEVSKDLFQYIDDIDKYPNVASVTIDEFDFGTLIY